jgi:AraC family transcriptional regulator
MRIKRLGSLTLDSQDPTPVQLLGAAIAIFDSDPDSAKACIQAAAELLQGRNEKGHGQIEFPAFRGGLTPWQANRVAAYIESNINSNLQVTDLAGTVHLSASHFFRAFRQTFGEPPHAYVTRQRIRRAQLIMRSSQTPLSQIALDCGMADQAHFTRVFRRVVGISPGFWRRQFPPLALTLNYESRRGCFPSRCRTTAYTADSPREADSPIQLHES